jgi:hypothetical protein
MRTVIIAGLVAAAAAAAILVNLGLLATAETSSDPVGKLTPSSYGLEPAVARPGGAGLGGSAERPGAHSRRATRSPAVPLQAVAAAPPPAAAASSPAPLTTRVNPARRQPRGTHRSGDRREDKPRVELKTETETVTVPLTTPTAITTATPAPASPATTGTAATATGVTSQTQTAQSASAGQDQPHDD